MLCFNFIKHGLIFGALGKQRLITTMGRTHRDPTPHSSHDRAWSPPSVLFFGHVSWFPGPDLWGVPRTVCKCCSVPLVKKKFHHGNHLGDAGSDRVKPSVPHSLLEG